MNKKILLIIIVILSIIGIIAITTLKPRIDFNKINISEEEWNSIIANRAEGNLSLKSLKFNDYDLIIDEENSKIYYSVIRNSKNKYSPVVSYIASTPNVRIAILNDEITEDKIMNNHEFKVILYDDNTYRTYGLYCTSFPMLNIACNEQGKSGNYKTKMSMYLFNNFDKGINRIVRSDGILHGIEMENGAYNYRFSLTMMTPGNNERENVLSLLRMRPSNEFFLNAINIGENDSPLKNNIREQKEVQDKFENKIDKSNENIINNKDIDEQRVELFINNKYIGLYSLSYNPDIKIKPRNR